MAVLYIMALYKLFNRISTLVASHQECRLIPLSVCAESIRTNSGYIPINCIQTLCACVHVWRPVWQAQPVGAEVHQDRPSSSI